MEESTPQDLRRGVVSCLLCIIVLSIYGNALYAGWQMDDRPNILDNTALQIHDLMPETLWQTFFSQANHKRLYRPFPSLSFALNWYLGKDDPFGYHFVNIAIHVLNAFLLYLVTAGLLRAPALKRNYSQEAIRFVALLAAALWAVNPIQTQAVTYIVQRMASMAAFFYLLGMYWYMQARLSAKGIRRALYFLACALSFLCALGSKENTIMLPAALLLVEFVFFQEAGSRGSQRIKRVVLCLAGGFLLVAIIAIVMGKGRSLFLAGGYQTRPFTLWQRLMTEPRIVLYYLSQIFYPLPSRLSIVHNVVLSTSLLHPWTTLPAILLIAGLISGALLCIRRWPLLAFGLLFFFLNHIVESTTIPLELIFEHRNYLPSLFLFMPLSAGIYQLIQNYRSRNKILSWAIIGTVTVVLAGWGYGTYIRNKAWKDRKTLWMDAMRKAPHSARALGVLGIELAWGEHPTPGKYKLARRFFEKSLSMTKARTFFDADILGNIAGTYFQEGRYRKAIPIYRQVLEMDPLFLKTRYELIKALILTGELNEASAQADILIANPKHYVKSEYLNIKGFILLWQKKPRQALLFFRKALTKDPTRPDVLLNIGVAFSQMGRYARGQWFLKQALKKADDPTSIYFYLIDNRLSADKRKEAERYAARLCSLASLWAISERLAAFVGNSKSAPLDVGHLSHFIMKYIGKQVAALDDGKFNGKAERKR